MVLNFEIHTKTKKQKEKPHTKNQSAITDHARD